MKLFTDPVATPRAFHLLAGGVLALKLFFAAALPITGDEVYFVTWGLHPALGYYDHPGMVGWWLSLLLVFGKAEWWLRLPAVVLPVALAYATVGLLRKHNERAAWLAGALCLFAPLHLVNVFISTDTPLILFSFLAAWAVYVALRDDRLGHYALAGLCLGLALLSKYIAGLLAVTLAVYVLWQKPDWRRLGAVLLMALCAAIPFTLNLYWNYENCGNNILFNLVTRSRTGTDATAPLVYLLMLAYLVTPPLLLDLWRRRRGLRDAASSPAGVFTAVLLLPAALLLLLAFKGETGLHWVLSFYPFLFLVAGRHLDLAALQRAWRFMFVFGLLHAAALAVLLALPVSFWTGKPIHRDLVVSWHIDAMLARLDALGEGRLRASEGYPSASLFSYKGDRHYAVFGASSQHGRQDDQWTDFRQWDGKNALVFLKGAKSLGKAYERYFDSSRVETFELGGITFHVLLGDGFRYARYRDDILAGVNAGYYRLPGWLRIGRCDFKERYGFER
jgi:4-amino-4-deoxy-L-arabinose transferase-like glycosyltransferase